jgi:hypothetical protein
MNRPNEPMSDGMSIATSQNRWTKRNLKQIRHPMGKCECRWFETERLDYDLCDDWDGFERTPAIRRKRLLGDEKNWLCARATGARAPDL